MQWADENSARADKNKARLCVIVEICYLCMREAMSGPTEKRCFLLFQQRTTSYYKVRSASAIHSVHHTILLTYAAKRQHCYYSDL